jgi:hypothetical protein
MASLSRTYKGSKTIAYTPRRRIRARQFRFVVGYRAPERYAVDQVPGSCMPLDTSAHWEWRNPLNILLAVLLLFVLAAIVGMLLH